MRITLPFGKENLSFSLPDAVVGRILSPPTLPAVQDVGGELGKELTNEHCRSFLARVENLVAGSSPADLDFWQAAKLSTGVKRR